MPTDHSNLNSSSLRLYSQVTLGWVKLTVKLINTKPFESERFPGPQRNSRLLALCFEAN